MPLLWMGGAPLPWLRVFWGCPGVPCPGWGCLRGVIEQLGAPTQAQAASGGAPAQAGGALGVPWGCMGVPCPPSPMLKSWEFMQWK